ncbi:MAG: hypothetical protein HQL37_03970 [Alphaproteobacteria bacterium]|nr:hypothetical protein [Alphaproteobacteria bacterium]
MTEFREGELVFDFGDAAALGIKEHSLTRMADKLRKRLKQDADIPWLHPYVTRSLVVTPENFSRELSRYGYTVHRK